jgi:hypothetical protein
MALGMGFGGAVFGADGTVGQLRLGDAGAAVGVPIGAPLSDAGATFTPAAPLQAAPSAPPA